MYFDYILPRVPLISLDHLFVARSSKPIQISRSTRACRSQGRRSGSFTLKGSWQVIFVPGDWWHGVLNLEEILRL